MFFKELFNLIPEGQMLTISLAKFGERLTGSVIPQCKHIKDPAINQMQPFTFNGLPEELDEDFLKIITQPVQKATELITNLSDYEKSIEKAKEESKEKKEKKDKITKLLGDLDTHIKSGDNKKALAICNKVLEIDPKNKTALEKYKTLTGQSKSENSLFNTLSASETPKTADIPANSAQEQEVEPEEELKDENNLSETDSEDELKALFSM